MTQDNDKNEVENKEQLADEWEERFERPRGALTDIDRRFMWDIKEYSHRETAAQRRRTIRERLANGVLDLKYLTMLRDWDAKAAYETVQSTQMEGGYAGLANLVHFLYLHRGRKTQPIERMVEAGIWAAEKEADSNVGKVSVEINVLEYDPEEVYARYQRNKDLEDPLSVDDLGILVREGMLDEDDLERLNVTDTPTGEAPDLDDSE